MRVVMKEIEVSTTQRLELIDITRDIEKIVENSGISKGLVHVFVPHATAAIIANENEAGLLEDYINLIKEIFKPGGPWKHNRIDDNAHAHLAAGLIGASRSFPIVNGRLVRGTWQNIFLLELDGPRSRRKVVVTIIGE